LLPKNPDSQFPPGDQFLDQDLVAVQQTVRKGRSYLIPGMNQVNANT
jgi:hypothetical protein